MFKFLNKIFLIIFLLLSILNISVAQELSQITNVQDFNQFRWPGNGALEGDSNLCVFSDTGKYSVKIQGSNNGFFLTDNITTIPYTVKWNDLPTSNNATAITHNVTLFNQTGATTNSDYCLNGNNANISINFNEADLQQASAGIYTGYITVIIEAEY